MPQLTIENPRLIHRELATIRQFTNQYSAFTPGGIRWLIFNEKQNGLSKAVVRIGRRVLIDVPAFFQWVQEKQVR